MPCETCGVEGPTHHVKFEQNIGMFYARRSLTLDRDLCRPCIRRYFRSFTLTTLFLGWWGIISLLMTPFFLINNLREYWGARKLPEPGIAAMNAPIAFNAAPAADRTFGFKLIYGVIVWTGVLAAVAYHQVGFIEKYAPALNAKIHGGEITDSSDGEYAGLQIRKDLDALNAGIKGTTWTDIRSEFLSRRSYLTDLSTQNDRLQRALVSERNANVGASDPCEEWAIAQFGPAMNAYTIGETKLFEAVRSSPEITSENAASLKALIDQQESAGNTLGQVSADNKSHGCKD